MGKSPLTFDRDNFLIFPKIDVFSGLFDRKTANLLEISGEQVVDFLSLGPVAGASGRLFGHYRPGFSVKTHVFPGRYMTKRLMPPHATSQR